MKVAKLVRGAHPIDFHLIYFINQGSTKRATMKTTKNVKKKVSTDSDKTVEKADLKNIASIKKIMACMTIVNLKA